MTLTDYLSDSLSLSLRLPWCAKQKGVVTTQPFGTCVVPDTGDIAEATAQARLSYDHVLVLGQWDLHINYPHLLPADWKPPSQE